MRFYSDDPVRDADRYTAWQDRNYVPYCWYCHNPIEGKVYETPGLGAEVCEDCYETYFREDDEN